MLSTSGVTWPRAVAAESLCRCDVVARSVDRKDRQGGSHARQNREATQVHGRRAAAQARGQENAHGHEREGARGIRQQAEEERLSASMALSEPAGLRDELEPILREALAPEERV